MRLRSRGREQHVSIQDLNIDKIDIMSILHNLWPWRMEGGGCGVGELCRPSSHVSMDVIIISRWSPLRVQAECRMTVEGNTASMTSDELIFGKSRRPEWGDKFVKI